MIISEVDCLRADSFYTGVFKKLLKQREILYVKELKNLLDQGLLVIKCTEPVLIRTYLPGKNDYELEIQESIQIVLKDSEYIESLKSENKALKERLAKIEAAVTGLSK